MIGNQSKKNNDDNDVQLQLETVAYTSIRVLMEMELVVRGYRLSQSSSSLHARRLDWQSSTALRQCVVLRKQLGECMARQSTALLYCSRIATMLQTPTPPVPITLISVKPLAPPIPSPTPLIATEPSYNDLDLSLEGLRDTIRQWLQTRRRVLTQLHGHVEHLMTPNKTEWSLSTTSTTLVSLVWSLVLPCQSCYHHPYYGLYHTATSLAPILNQMESWSRADVDMLYDTLGWLGFSHSLPTHPHNNNSSDANAALQHPHHKSLMIPLGRLHDRLRSGVRRLTLHRSRFLRSSLPPTHNEVKRATQEDDTKSDDNEASSSPIDTDLEYIGAILTEAQMALTEAKAAHATRPKSKTISTAKVSPSPMVALTSEGANEIKVEGDDRRGHLIVCTLPTFFLLCYVVNDVATFVCPVNPIGYNRYHV
jgi:hypothetical protein